MNRLTQYKLKQIIVAEWLAMITQILNISQKGAFRYRSFDRT